MDRSEIKRMILKYMRILVLLYFVASSTALVIMGILVESEFYVGLFIGFIIFLAALPVIIPAAIRLSSTAAGAISEQFEESAKERAKSEEDGLAAWADRFISGDFNLTGGPECLQKLDRFTAEFLGRVKAAQSKAIDVYPYKGAFKEAADTINHMRSGLARVNDDMAQAIRFMEFKSNSLADGNPFCESAAGLRNALQEMETLLASLSSMRLSFDPGKIKYNEKAAKSAAAIITNYSQALSGIHYHILAIQHALSELSKDIHLLSDISVQQNGVLGKMRRTLSALARTADRQHMMIQESANYTTGPLNGQNPDPAAGRELIRYINRIQAGSKDFAATVGSLDELLQSVNILNESRQTISASAVRLTGNGSNMSKDAKKALEIVGKFTFTNTMPFTPPDNRPRIAVSEDKTYPGRHGGTHLFDPAGKSGSNAVKTFIPNTPPVNLAAAPRPKASPMEQGANFESKDFGKYSR